MQSVQHERSRYKELRREIGREIFAVTRATAPHSRAGACALAPMHNALTDSAYRKIAALQEKQHKYEQAFAQAGLELERPWYKRIAKFFGL